MLKLFLKIIAFSFLILFFISCPPANPVTNVIDLASVTSINPDDPVVSYAFWAQISANDPNGVIITGVEAGDEIFISDLSNYCSFKHSVLEEIKGFISLANALTSAFKAVLNNKTSAVLNGAFAAATHGLEDIFSGEVDNGDKRRDGFGKDPNSGEYATNEGGILVCMPQSKGAIYASNDNHLDGDCHKNGRLTPYYRGEVARTNSFFPCNLPTPGAIMSRMALIDGNIHILAFDHDFEDNTGYYFVQIALVRNNLELMPGKTAEDYVDAMVADGFF